MPWSIWLFGFVWFWNLEYLCGYLFFCNFLVLNLVILYLYCLGVFGYFDLFGFGISMWLFGFVIFWFWIWLFWICIALEYLVFGFVWFWNIYVVIGFVIFWFWIWICIALESWEYWLFGFGVCGFVWFWNLDHHHNCMMIII
jgi:hypothetical protein